MRLLLIAVASAAVFGQTAPPAAPSGPNFEVASVKPNLHSKAGGEGSRRQSVTVDPGRLTMINVTLQTCIRTAFEVRDYQISGPAWLEEERYDISAKAADAVPEKDLHLMLQRLLAERFRLEYHRQTKDLPAYVLTIAKGGPKFHESKTEGEFSVKPLGRTVATVERASVAQLVDLLTQVMRAPVLDETGLKAKYDITIDMTSYIPENMQHGPGAAPPDFAGIAMAVVQEQLGLKLESRKVASELIVIDHAEKAPTEN